MRVLLPSVASGQRQHRPSLDGQWLAYVGEVTGAREVYVQCMRGGSGRWQVSAGGGVEPVWSPDGTELFYRGGGALVAARLATSPKFNVLRRDTRFAVSSRLSDGGVVRRDPRRQALRVLTPVELERVVARVRVG